MSAQEPGSRRLRIDLPGATRSGPREVLPRLDQSGTVSSPIPGVLFMVFRAHGDHVRVEGGSLRRPLVALVARRHDYHDALAPGYLDGVRKRVHPVVLATVGAERQVEHPDVHARVVAMLNNPVYGGQYLGYVRRAVGGRGLSG